MLNVALGLAISRWRKIVEANCETIVFLGLKFHCRVTVIKFVLSVFEEPEDPNSRSFFSEIISSISDVKFSHNGRYMITRDYLSVKVWDLNMENRPVETFQVGKDFRLPPCLFESVADLFPTDQET